MFYKYKKIRKVTYKSMLPVEQRELALMESVWVLRLGLSSLMSNISYCIFFYLIMTPEKVETSYIFKLF